MVACRHRLHPVMLKVGGQWVSPFEVESALLGHEAVLEAAVVGAEDERDPVKPKAYVVACEGVETDEAFAAALQEFVKDRLAPFKYPRWIDSTGDLPKTATGKIQRFKLRRLPANLRPAARNRTGFAGIAGPHAGPRRRAGEFLRVGVSDNASENGDDLAPAPG